MAAQKKSQLFDVTRPSRDLARIAEAEGFGVDASGVSVSEEHWNEIALAEGDADEWFRLVFERLRHVLLATPGDPDIEAFRERAVFGEALRVTGSAFSAEFMERIKAGHRGVAPGGCMAAIDVPLRTGRKVLVLVFCMPPGPNGRSRIEVMLASSVAPK